MSQIVKLNSSGERINHGRGSRWVYNFLYWNWVFCRTL